MRLLEIAALAAAAAALAACEKAEDRAALASAPKFDLRYCVQGDLAPTFRMPPGGCVASNNGAYFLEMTQDGVLRTRAVRGGLPGETVWSSVAKATTPDVSSMVFQTDGNLVVYNAGLAVWNIRAFGPGDYRLSLTDHGDLLIRTAEGQTVWQAWFDPLSCPRSLKAPTQIVDGCLVSPSGTYVMVLDPTGDAQVIQVQGGGKLGGRVWTTGTKGSAPRSTLLAVQQDGNLVIYDAGKPVWNSGTGGHRGAVRLELTDKGELQLHGPGDALLWSSKTGRSAKA